MKRHSKGKSTVGKKKAMASAITNRERETDFVNGAKKPTTGLGMPY